MSPHRLTSRHGGLGSSSPAAQWLARWSCASLPAAADLAPPERPKATAPPGRNRSGQSCSGGGGHWNQQIWGALGDDAFARPELALFVLPGRLVWTWPNCLAAIESCWPGRLLVRKVQEDVLSLRSGELGTGRSPVEDSRRRCRPLREALALPLAWACCEPRGAEGPAVQVAQQPRVLKVATLGNLTSGRRRDLLICGHACRVVGLAADVVDEQLSHVEAIGWKLPRRRVLWAIVSDGKKEKSAHRKRRGEERKRERGEERKRERDEERKRESEKEKQSMHSEKDGAPLPPFHPIAMEAAEEQPHEAMLILFVEKLHRSEVAASDVEQVGSNCVGALLEVCGHRASSNFLKVG
eukprot:scaffold4850_cov213-Pinguiococcus_pyrenoidosus.AAC.8